MNLNEIEVEYEMVLMPDPCGGEGEPPCDDDDDSIPGGGVKPPPPPPGNGG